MEQKPFEVAMTTEEEQLGFFARFFKKVKIYQKERSFQCNCN